MFLEGELEVHKINDKRKLINFGYNETQFIVFRV